MTTLTNQDLQFILTRIPKDVRTLMKDRGLLLGGGFIRATISGEKPSDVDIFGKSKEQLEAAARALSDKRFKSRVHESSNAYTVLSGQRLPVQFIHRWLFNDPRSCMDSFDFTIAQAIIWFEGTTWHSVCHENFYSDLAAKRLVYCSPIRNEDAGGSILRVRKFLSRGYNIQAPSFAAVMARLFSAVDWQKISSEQAATKVLTGLLREVDPLLIVDGMDVVDEHELLPEDDE